MAERKHVHSNDSGWSSALEKECAIEDKRRFRGRRSSSCSPDVSHIPEIDDFRGRGNPGVPSRHPSRRFMPIGPVRVQVPNWPDRARSTSKPTSFLLLERRSERGVSTRIGVFDKCASALVLWSLCSRPSGVGEAKRHPVGGSANRATTQPIHTASHLVAASWSLRGPWDHRNA